MRLRNQIYNSNSHRRGGNWNTTWTPELVSAAPDPIDAFAAYAQQTLGVPWPTLQDMLVLRKKVAEFFAHYPRCDFYSLCRVVAWCRSKRKRFSRVWMIVDQFRLAYAEGALPEIDPGRRDGNLDNQIAHALATETDASWRRRLLVARGTEARRQVYDAWVRR